MEDLGANPAFDYIKGVLEVDMNDRERAHALAAMFLIVKTTATPGDARRLAVIERACLDLHDGDTIRGRALAMEVMSVLSTMANDPEWGAGGGTGGTTE